MARFYTSPFIFVVERERRERNSKRSNKKSPPLSLSSFSFSLRVDAGRPMEFAPRASAVTEASSSLSPSAAIDQETLWQMSLRGNETMESGPYPERPGDPDCAYYMRTGLCRFGMSCRFNHPVNRNLVVAAARMKGGYPERVGQPECQYYLRMGTCKFGPTCKFHHPVDKAGIAGRVQLNILSYPLRPGEKECAYYLRTGLCKFGTTCKFNHPQPSNAMGSLRGSPVYTSVHSPTTPVQQSYPGGLANWPPSRASYIPSPRWQGPSGYAQIILPQGLVQVPSWNTFSGQIGPGSSPDSQQTPYGASRQTPMGQYAVQRENIFPERPDEPECQFYMKTGDCKFGAVCRFHHPRERYIPAPNCVLSPLGLPLRPGEPLCIFYSRYGVCKFGPNCKFDHPMGIFAYGVSTPPALMLSSESSVEPGPGSRRLSLSDPRRGDENIESEGLHG